MPVQVRHELMSLQTRYKTAQGLYAREIGRSDELQGTEDRGRLAQLASLIAGHELLLISSKRAAKAEKERLKISDKLEVALAEVGIV